MKRILLQGTLTSGLYQLDLTKADPSLLHKLSKSCTAVYVSSCNASVVAESCINTLYSSSAAAHINKTCITPTVALHTNVHFATALTDTWHARLGHPFFFVLKHALKFVPAVSNNITQPKFCDSCKCGKLNQLPFPNSVTKTSQPLELVYTDV
ncbi:hypothetical protein ACOSQ2_022568 [Xanthoceras sorbifolium]